ISDPGGRGSLAMLYPWIGLKTPTTILRGTWAFEGGTPRFMSVTQIQLVHDEAAHALLADDRFLLRWQMLHERCPHATAFQAPGFVRAWYASYRGEWQPVILQAGSASGDLVGLWLLAYNPRTSALAHAGAHQAEYHAWL